MKSSKEFWMDLFDSSLDQYKNEDDSFRNLAMVLHVFKFEFKKLKQYVSELKFKNELLQSKQLSVKQNCTCNRNIRSPLATLSVNRDNERQIKTEAQTSQIDNSILEAMFIDDTSDSNASLSKENDTLFIDDSSNEIDLNKSPTLSNNKRRSKRRKIKKEILNNSTVIQGTPILKVNKFKKLKQSTLTSFNNIKTETSSITKDITKLLPNSKIMNDCDNDETFYLFPENKEESVLEQTNLFNSKIKLDNSYDCVPVIDKTPEYNLKGKPVRKKSERMKLQGWSCEDCKEYYLKMNLPEEELRQRMNQCSKHRHDYRPVRLTPKGYWNPDFTPTQNSFAFNIE